MALPLVDVDSLVLHWLLKTLFNKARTSIHADIQVIYTPYKYPILAVDTLFHVSCITDVTDRDDTAVSNAGETRRESVRASTEYKYIY